MLKWHKRFAEGRESLEDDKHTVQPRTARPELKIQEVAMFVCANHSQMVDDVAAAEISHGTCRKILPDYVNTSHVTQHSVPHVLMQD